MVSSEASELDFCPSVYVCPLFFFAVLKTALEKIAFLPFAYTIDQYRWALFDGSLSTSEMNYQWWKLR